MSSFGKPHVVQNDLTKKKFCFSGLPEGGVRYLNDAEQFFYNIHRTLDGYLVACGIARIEGDLDPVGIRAALNCLQNRNPLLRSRIVDADVPFFEVREDPLEIPLIVEEHVDDQRWRLVSAQIVREDYTSADAPLMRVALLQRSNDKIHDLLVCCHHSIIDADALVSTIERLLLLHESWKAGNLKIGDEALPLTFYPVLPPYQFIDKLKFVAQGVSELLKPSAKICRDIDWNAGAGEHLPVLDVLDECVSKALVERCRAESTSVYGFMHAVTMCTLLPYLQQDNDKIRNSIAIKLRTRIEPVIPPEEYGAFISVVSESYRVNRGENIWEAARSAKSRINRTLDEMQHFKEFSRVRWKRRKDYSSFKGRSFAAAIDSLGVFETKKKYGDLIFNSYSQMANMSSLGPGIGIVVCSINDRINITLVSRVLSNEELQSYRKHFMSILMEAIA